MSTTASRVSIGGQPATLFRDLIPLGVVPAEAAGAVLWVADATDTTVDVRGRIVATPLLAPTPASIRANSYTYAVALRRRRRSTRRSRRFARRGAAAVLLVATPPVDSAFEVVSSARSRGAYDVDRAVPRAAERLRPHRAAARARQRRDAGVPGARRDARGARARSRGPSSPCASSGSRCRR